MAAGDPCGVDVEGVAGTSIARPLAARVRVFLRTATFQESNPTVEQEPIKRGTPSSRSGPGALVAREDVAGVAGLRTDEVVSHGKLDAGGSRDREEQRLRA